MTWSSANRSTYHYKALYWLYQSTGVDTNASNNSAAKAFLHGLIREKKCRYISHVYFFAGLALDKVQHACTIHTCTKSTSSC